MMKQRGLPKKLSGRLLGMLPLAAVLVAGCSGGLGDGVKLEEITIRSTDATLDPDGNRADGNLVIAQCNLAALDVATRYSDGEISSETGRVRWRTLGPNADKIVIVSNGDPALSQTSQVPIAVEPTAVGETVTLEANFAGRIETVEVEIRRTELQLEPNGLTFAVGLDTQLSALVVQGGQRVFTANSSVDWLAENVAGDPIAVGTKDDDSEATGDIRNGVLRASAEGSATVSATLDLLSDNLVSTTGVDLQNVCKLMAPSVTVVAETPTALEIVPNFVSANSANQSSDSNLFLATGTSTFVTVNALFDNGQKQNVTGAVRWERSSDDQAALEADSTANVPILPDFSGRVSAGADDNEISPAELTAILTLGIVDGSDDTVTDDVADVSQMLTLNIQDYAAENVELVATPTNGGVLAFGAASPLQLLGRFTSEDNDGNTVTDLELLLSSNIDFTNVFLDSDGSPSDDLTRLVSTDLTNQLVAVPSKVVLDAIETEAASQTVKFGYSNDVDANGDNLVLAESAILTFTAGPRDFDVMQQEPDFTMANSDQLFIALKGESSEPASVPCVEIGDTLEFDALVRFADSNNTSFLPARVTEAASSPDLANPTANATDTMYWSVTGSSSATVFNTVNRRGRVSITGNMAGSATVTATYTNNRDDSEDTADTRFQDSASQAITIEMEGDCEA